MDPCIRLVFELIGPEPSVFVGQLLGLDNHAGGLVRGVRENNPCAQEPHKLSALDRKSLGHDAYEWISLRSANHCETDSGVPRASFDNCLTGQEFTVFFSPFDDAHREAILDRPAGILALELRIDLDPVLGLPGRDHVVEFYHRGLPDRFIDAPVDGAPGGLLESAEGGFFVFHGSGGSCVAAVAVGSRFWCLGQRCCRRGDTVPSVERGTSDECGYWNSTALIASSCQPVNGL
mmetsp:Transcript_7759/g.15981  ORF Transcript_7759/g.15981 Transcript_7759/m.15981 type:complete len:234 (-) Transcript_7759:74-775(-)